MLKFKTTGLLNSLLLVAGLLFFAACGVPVCETTMPEKMALDSVNDQDIAMDGYDVTAFFTKQKATKGSAQFQSNYKGINYHFENESAKALFDRNPEKYLPAFGGYCAVAASFAKVEAAQIDLFDLYKGKLYFARNAKAEKMWMEDKDGVKSRAEGQWPCLVAKSGRNI